MTENKAVIFLVRAEGGSAISPVPSGAPRMAELLIPTPSLFPPLCQPKCLCSHPRNQTELLPAGRKNKVAGYFFGWDQLPDLVRHINAQTLPLAAGRASGGKWKKQLGVEEGGEGWMCNCRAGTGLWQARGAGWASAPSRRDSWQQKAAMLMMAELFAETALPSTLRFVAGLQRLSKMATVSVGQLHFYQGDFLTLPRSSSCITAVGWVWF